MAGVELFGGFDGTEILRSERESGKHLTTLSGDIDRDDAPQYENNEENCYHVVVTSLSNSSSVIDGFTISGGNADGPFMPDFQNRGAAIYNSGGDVAVISCTITSNSANSGAVHTDTGNPLIQDCTFTDNASTGLDTRTSGQPVVLNCLFQENEFGGVFSDTNGVRIIDSVFTFNGSSKIGTGGGIDLFGDECMIGGCFFVGNQASFSGGGISNESSGSVINNCVFVGNIAGSGDHIWNMGDLTILNCSLGKSGEFGGLTDGVVTGYGSLTLANCVLWGSGDGSEHDQIDALNSNPGIVSINHSIVQGWTGKFGGIGNNGLDPMFVDPDGPDEIPGTQDDNLRLLPGSPAIDSGDSTALPADEFDLDGDGDVTEPIPFDLDGLARLVDDPATKDTGVPLCNGDACLPTVDRGAYEFRPPPPTCEGDANLDGVVDPLDAGYVLARFGCSVGTGDPLCDAADVDADGLVDPLDAGYVLARFGSCP